MSRDDVSSFLHTLQLSIDSLQRRIDQSIVQLQHIKTNDLPSFLDDERHRFVSWHQEQLDSLDQLHKTLVQSLQRTSSSPPGHHQNNDINNNTDTINNDDNNNDDDDHTPFGVHLRSLEQRVAAMGGIPALGSVVLPRNTVTGKPVLKTTSSAAAVEMLHRSLHHHNQNNNNDNGNNDDSITSKNSGAFSPLRKVKETTTNTINTNTTTNTNITNSSPSSSIVTLPQVSLRKVVVSDTDSKKKEMEALNSELAIALQKRAQKQQQQE